MKERRLLVSLGSACMLLALIVMYFMVACAPAPTITPTPKPTPTPTPTPTPIKLTYAHQDPETSWSVTKAAHPWILQMEAATQGRVKFTEYYGQTLVKGADSWQSLKSGIADFGFNFLGYWPGMMPLSEVMLLPFIPYPSAEASSAILWQLYEKYPAVQQEFKDNKSLLFYTTDIYFIGTSRKQIKTLEDMKGLKIRVPGGPPMEMMKALGASPVAVGTPDVYMALQKGEIDAASMNWSGVDSYKWYEVCKYYTILPLFTSIFSQAASLNAWNRLPSDIQGQIMSVCGLKGSKFFGKAHFDDGAAVIPDNIKKQGYEYILYTIPSEELKRWQEVAGKPLWDDWVNKMKIAGHPEAQEMLDWVLNMAKTYK